MSIARAVQKPLEEFRGLILEVAYRPLGAWGPGAEAVLQVGEWRGAVNAAWCGCGALGRAAAAGAAAHGCASPAAACGTYRWPLARWQA